MAKKLRVGVIFGGQSGEHEVSLVSAASVIRALNKKFYQIIPIGISKKGQWFASGDPLRALKENNLSLTNPALPVINPTTKTFLRVGEREIKLDVAFPVLHGTYGEDGRIQGLFEMANLAYVGSGVLGSALGLDKVVQKQLFQSTGLPVVKFLWFLENSWLKDHTAILKMINQKLTYPLFVKPANLGSSVGISKVHHPEDLTKAIKLASRFDRKIIVEQGVKNAREIECSVLGNDEPCVAKTIGEVIPSGEFYDYEAKYIDGRSKLIIGAKLPRRVAKTIKSLALKAYQTLDSSGLARVDFLVQKKTNKIYLNEINTLPGFTSISMYPKLWEQSGLTYSKLLDQLIKLARERQAAKDKLTRSFNSRSDWYK